MRMSHEGVVPYVTPYEAELGDPGRYRLVRRFASGLSEHIDLVDERPDDRDGWGVLWRRQVDNRAGRPQYGMVHVRRQREAMRRQLCQVCGQLATRTPQGTLWMLPDAETADAWYAGQDVVTGNPPICRVCVALVLRYCPHMATSDDCVVVAPVVRPWGVGGVLLGGTEDTGTEMGYYAYRDIEAVRPYLVATCMLAQLRHE